MLANRDHICPLSYCGSVNFVDSWIWAVRDNYRCGPKEISGRIFILFHENISLLDQLYFKLGIEIQVFKDFFQYL